MEQSQTKAENSMYAFEVLLFIQLLKMIIRGKSPLCFPSDTALLSTEMTIKDIWLDILGLKMTVEFRQLYYMKIFKKTPVLAIDTP